jgi:hypothetical protein
MSLATDPTPSFPPHTPLTLDDLPVGTPLAWPVVDQDGTLLFERGATLVDERERAFLFEHFAPCRGDPLTIADPAMADASPEPTSIRDMQLAIGASMGLRTQLNSSARMQPCRLIGFAPDGTLFVTPPQIDGRAMPLIIGENVEMVAISRQAVFRFVCTVDAVCVSPFEYGVLSPPSAIRRLRRRNSIRVNARIPVRCGIGENGSGYDGLALAKGVSATGLSLTASWRLGEIGERVRVAFRLHSAGIDAPIATVAIIRNVQSTASEGGDTITHGLELDRLTPSEQMAMKAFMFDRHEDSMDWSSTTR